MARVEAEVPEEWKKKLISISKKRDTPQRQLVKDAVYQTYIKKSEKDNVEAKNCWALKNTDL